jgi:hypothetical protein
MGMCHAIEALPVVCPDIARSTANDIANFAIGYARGGTYPTAARAAAESDACASRRKNSMLLSTFASLAAAISGFSATASLIYVAVQTRQSVRHTRALIHQGAATRTTSLLLGLMNTEAVAARIVGNGGTPTPELIRRRQFHYHCGTAMIAMEDYFTQHQERHLSDEQFARGSVTFRQALTGPGLRAYWLRHREVMIKAAPPTAPSSTACAPGKRQPLAIGRHDARSLPQVRHKPFSSACPLRRRPPGRTNDRNGRIVDGSIPWDSGSSAPQSGRGRSRTARQQPKLSGHSHRKCAPAKRLESLMPEGRAEFLQGV